MHQLEEDRQYRPLSEAVSFNKMREEVHDLALYLEKCGFETYGVNTDLYAVINVGKHKYTIYPSYLSFNNKININIPSLNTEFDVSYNNISKVFKKDSFITRAILDYQSAMDEYKINIAPFEKSLKSAELAFRNIVTMAEELDNI